MPKRLDPQDSFIIEDLETLRVLSDPIRTQIYEILLPEPATIRQVAGRLGLTPSRLYYHINIMEKQGLVRVVETRMVSNMVEKLYRARAYALQVSPELLNFNTASGDDAVRQILIGNIDATRDDLIRSLQARQYNVEHGAQKRKRNAMVNRVTACVPDEYADEFHQRLQALIMEFSGRDEPAAKDSPGYQHYALQVAFYPTFYFSESDTPASPPDAQDP